MAGSLLRFHSDVLVILVRLCNSELQTLCLTPCTLVEVFERRDFDVEVGASISCAANGRVPRSPFNPGPDRHASVLIQGTQWLREWEANIPMMKPINLQKLVMRDWETGHILNQYDQGDYEATWGHPSLMFYRQDMHRGLFHTATSEEGKGVPCKVVVDHM